MRKRDLGSGRIAPDGEIRAVHELVGEFLSRRSDQVGCKSLSKTLGFDLKVEEVVNQRVQILFR